MTQRNHEWLVRYVTQSIADTPRNRRYLALVSAGTSDFCGLDDQWLATCAGTAVDDYRKARAQTNSLGRLAFCHHTPGTPHYQCAAALERVRRGLLGVASHIDETGAITWIRDLNKADHLDSYLAHSWCLEPCLMAMLWIRERLDASDRERIDAALRRAGKYLIEHPWRVACNAGAAIGAVSVLAALYFDEPDWLVAVGANYGDIVEHGVIAADGEVGEHNVLKDGGPDSNYTYTGWSYAYLWGLLTGRIETDVRYLAAVRWQAQFHARPGQQLAAGAAVRRRIGLGSLHDLLPAYEHFSHCEPFFADLAAHTLATVERRKSGFWGHIVSSLIWAMFERGPEAEGATPPGWLADCTRPFERDRVGYALIGRAKYQTGVVFRSWTKYHNDWPLRGMQVFAWGDEQPVLLHTEATNSATLADGVDTAAADVEKGSAGWEVSLDRGETIADERCGLATLAMRQRHIWTLYAYTPASAVAVYGGARGEIVTRWVTGARVAPFPVLDEGARCVSFPERQGRIYYLRGRAKLTEEMEPNAPAGAAPVRVLEVVAPAPVSVFAFSDARFRFGEFRKDELLFADASGAYRLSLEAVLGPDGGLNRAVKGRLCSMVVKECNESATGRSF